MAQVAPTPAGARPRDGLDLGLQPRRPKPKVDESGWSDLHIGESGGQRQPARQLGGNLGGPAVQFAGQLEGQGDAVVAVGRIGGPFYHQRRERCSGQTRQAGSSLANGLVDKGRGRGDGGDDQGCVPSATSRLSFCVPRCTVRVTWSPGWNWRSTSFNGCASSRLWPLTAVITSLTRNPARAAGDPASMACTSAPTGMPLAVAVVSSTMA